MDELNALRTFFDDAVEHFADGAGAWDYEDFYESGEKTGLLKEEAYSVEKHGEMEYDPEEGATIWVPSGLARRPAAREAAAG